MSRNKPPLIPEGMSVDIQAHRVVVKGPKGEIHLLKPNSGNPAADAGTQASLIKGAIIGLSQGFVKNLEIIGTGYRALVKDKGLELFLGYSHSIVFNPPESVSLAVKDNRFITVTGADKNLVGQTAANLRRLRRPDAYKGKGIRYLGELIKLKPGKAAKAAGE